MAAAEQAGALEGIAEAPMGSARVPTRSEAIINVATALADAKHLVVSSVLSELLTLLSEMGETPPETTALLANYPNPFNPETWIPYQLAKPADVTITIYATNGQVVRQLALGHQAAGVYQSRSRAAYWDGRNAVGEPVASGLYFYTLTAGDFSATRKMSIRK